MLHFQCFRLDISFLFSFATKEVKGVNYSPSQAKDLEIWKKDVKENGL